MAETELKFRLDGDEPLARLRGRLVSFGARHLATHREQNHLFDEPDGRLRARGHVLRVRVLDGGPRAVLTVKGPAAFSGAVKTRDEHEVGVDDAAGLVALLGALGYAPTLRYDKTREEWRLGGVVVALDDLAFGTFCELEGPEDEINTLAARLGLDPARAERLGYPALLAMHLEAVARSR